MGVILTALENELHKRGAPLRSTEGLVFKPESYPSRSIYPVTAAEQQQLKRGSLSRCDWMFGAALISLQ